MANAERSRQLSNSTSMWMVYGMRLKLQLKRFGLNISPYIAEQVKIQTTYVCDDPYNTYDALQCMFPISSEFV